MAPSFDHASSLGRELRDERRIKNLGEGTVGNYVQGGSGGIYWTSTDEKGTRSLQLVIRAGNERPVLFCDGLAGVKMLSIPDVESVFDQILDGWMSTPAMELFVTLNNA